MVKTICYYLEDSRISSISVSMYFTKLIVFFCFIVQGFASVVYKIIDLWRDVPRF